MPEISYAIGLDLGQASDYSALCVVEREADGEARAAYTVRELHRWKLGTPYTRIVGDVAALAAKPPLPDSALVVDATGVGRAVVDLFRSAELPARLVPVTITGVMLAPRPQEGGAWHTPKKDLVGVMMTLIQAGRFHIVPTLKYAKVLGREIQEFRVRVTAAGNETFEPLRARDHDDCVLSVALACWYCERGHPAQIHVLDPQGPGTPPAGQLPGVAMWEGGPTHEEYAAELEKLKQRPPQFGVPDDLDPWGEWRRREPPATWTESWT
jgi:hypothetical protein